MRVSIIALLISFIYLPAMAELAMPDYSEYKITDSNEIKDIKSGLRFETTKMGLPKCKSAHPEMKYWSLENILTTLPVRRSELHVLPGNRPLVVVRVYYSLLLGGLLIEDHPVDVVDILFYSNERKTRLEKMLLNEYVIEYEKVNEGTLLKPRFATKMTIADVLESECEKPEE